MRFMNKVLCVYLLVSLAPAAAETSSPHLDSGTANAEISLGFLRGYSTTTQGEEERALESSNKKKKSSPPTKTKATVTPTPAPTSLEGDQVETSTPSPTPKPQKKDKHTKVAKTLSPTFSGGDANESSVSEGTSTATPSPTPKPHKKKDKPKETVATTLTPTSSLEAAEEELIEDEISLLNTEQEILNSVLNKTNGTAVWNLLNATNATSSPPEYDDVYGNSKSSTEISSTEINAATLQDELIKNINEEEAQVKAAANTSSPTSVPPPLPAKPKKGYNASTTDSKNATDVPKGTNGTDSSTTSLPGGASSTNKTKDNATTFYDDFEEYYEEIIEEYEGTTASTTSTEEEFSDSTDSPPGEYYYYYGSSDKTPKNDKLPNEEEEYDLTKVTAPTSTLDLATTPNATDVQEEKTKDQSYYSTTPFTSSSSSEASASFTAEEQSHNLKLMAFGMTIAMLVFMIFTAYQVSENPDGIYASCCRLSVAVAICIIRGLLTPCRTICCRPSGHHLISSAPDYREPYRGRRGHMELT